MRIEERRSDIIARLRAEQTVHIRDLAEQFAVSRETIRKDLYALEQQGIANLIRGGAILRDTRRDSVYEQRRSVNIAGKLAVAAAAAALVEPGMTVFLDYGTTTHLLAEQLLSTTPLTVVTNTLPIVQVLLNNPQIDLVMPGGHVHADEDSMYGPLALNNLERLYFDIGFFGCAGVSADRGVTNYHVLEADFSRLAMEHADRSFLLADSTKFGNAALNKVVDLDALAAVITDAGVDPAEADRIREAGLPVQIAHAD